MLMWPDGVCPRMSILNSRQMSEHGSASQDGPFIWREGTGGPQQRQPCICISALAISPTQRLIRRSVAAASKSHYCAGVYTMPAQREPTWFSAVPIHFQPVIAIWNAPACDYSSFDQNGRQLEP